MLPFPNGSVFLTIAKQAGWNNESRTGYFKESFQDKKSHIVLMLGSHEIAEILQCFREKRAINNVEVDYSSRDSVLDSTKKASFFHRSQNGDKSLKLYPSKENCSDGAFVLGVSDITNRINIGMILTSSEARMIEEALSALLQKMFFHEIDDSIAYSVKNQGNGKSKNGSSKKSPKEDPMEEDEFADTDDGTGSELEDDEEDMPF
jgi:hypothetical protein